MVDRGGEERRRQMPLFPVTEKATRRALKTTTGGGKETDDRVYAQYQAELLGKHTGFADTMDVLVRLRTNQLHPEAFNPHAYAGGMMIFHATVAEHALINGIAMPQITPIDPLTVLDTDVMQGATNPERLHSVLQKMAKEMNFPGLTPGTSLVDRQRVVQKLFAEKEIHHLLIDEEAEENRRSLEELQDAMRAGLASRSGQFPQQERAFVRAMSDHWWNDIHPVMGASQVFGAVDARAVIQAAQVRENS